jgi:hypothetical protein
VKRFLSTGVAGVIVFAVRTAMAAVPSLDDYAKSLSQTMEGPVMPPWGPLLLWSIGIVAVGVMLILLIRRYTTPSLAERENQELYRYLLDVHRLTEVDRRTLDQFVRLARLRNPVLILVKRSVFTTCVERHLGLLKSPESRRNFEKFFHALERKLYA